MILRKRFDQSLEVEARIIAERLSDLKGLGFYCNAVSELGFQRCYELASLSLVAAREGKVYTTAARYFNGCVKRERGEK